MNTQKDSNKLAYILLTGLVILWGVDYVVAKTGLEVFTPMTLLFCKYSIGFITISIVKLVQRNKKLVRVRDIPLFIICAVFGEVLYFNCDYNAIQIMPVSLVSIILAFVPVVSIMIERIIFKVKPSKKTIIGMTICIAGVILVIGADVDELVNGRLVGYLLAFGAVFSWNIYNYITAYLKGYDSVTLTCMQMLCTICIISPVALHNMPPLWELTPQTIVSVIYLGVGAAGFGFLIMVYGLKKLGPTTSAIYSNFLPVTTTITGWIFLKESISVLQIIGGIIVIAAGYIVIKEKGKREESSEELIKS